MVMHGTVSLGELMGDVAWRPRAAPVTTPADPMLGPAGSWPRVLLGCSSRRSEEVRRRTETRGGETRPAGATVRDPGGNYVDVVDTALPGCQIWMHKRGYALSRHAGE